ncbi:MAG: hypothetical protein E7340_04275 [Clostridiales bacterium]|nr:hypothetical protein [Clostridiales bacterium]
MKKILVAVVSLVMTLVMSMTFLGGCNLVTVDNERNMNQVIATVKIAADAPEENIYKKEVAMSYINYGYIYEQSYGYTRERVINLIVNQLITTRVYVQNAIIQFNNADSSSIYYGNVVNEDKGTWDLDRYLTEDEIIDAEYMTKKDMNSMIHGYMEGHDHGVTDTIVGEVRAVPTDAANKEKELTNAQKQAYKIDTNSSTDRRAAYNEVIELLEQNELLGNYDGSIESTAYYKDSLKSYKENTIVEKFEKAINDAARKSVTYEDLQNVYENNFNTQSEMSDSEFAEKLSSATAEDPVLVGRNGTYGYVYNLLLGADSNQTAKINDIETTDIAKKAELRKEILDKTIVKDLRSTWLLSGYDFDTETNCFTGDYTLVKDAKNSLPFGGTVTHVNKDHVDDEEYTAQYRIDSIKEYTLDEFVKMMDEYVYGSVQSNAKTSSDGVSIYKKVVNNSAVEEYDAKINELLFAFSTDPGSLNTYKGYTIEPIPDVGSETYVQEFADAGRELIALGGKSYIIVATDYGYHVMFFSQAFTGIEGFSTLESYLNFAMDTTGNVSYWEDQMKALVENWDDEDVDTDTFLYKFFNSVASTRVSKQISKVQNKLLNDHVYNANGGVTKYADRYADLIEG